jgi:hypothetical protein
MAKKTKDHPKHEHPSGKRHRQKQSNSPYARLFGIAFTVDLLLTIGLYVVSFCGGLKATDSPPPMQFFIVNLLSIFVLTAIVVQIYIAHQQWRVMGIAIEPRVRITNITIENLIAGQRPVIILEIANEGATDAKDVGLHIRADVPGGGAKWSDERTVTIAAHSKQKHFLPWPHIATSIPYKRLRKLQVSGYFRLNNQHPNEFCFQYYWWNEGDRPNGLPDFLPCDFDPSITTLVDSGGTITPEGESSKTIGKTLGGVITPSGSLTMEVIKGDKSKDTETKEDEGQNPN